MNYREIGERKNEHSLHSFVEVSYRGNFTLNTGPSAAASIFSILQLQPPYLVVYGTFLKSSGLQIPFLLILSILRRIRKAFPFWWDESRPTSRGTTRQMFFALSPRKFWGFPVEEWKTVYLPVQAPLSLPFSLLWNENEIAVGQRR